MTSKVVALACLSLLSTAAPTAAPTRWIEPVTGMAFVEIPAGTFVMGSPADEPGREPQEQQHQVTISRAFWLGATEVTQSQWERVMGTNPSHFRSSDGALPVERVNWYEVRDFLRRLTALSPGHAFRLPSEAQWEYACRAGTTTAYSAGATLDRARANVSPAPDTPVDRRGGTLRVGSFAPNAWGLFDMHGNVWEWTEDEPCPYSSGPVTDPQESCGVALKVIRGGSWYFAAECPSLR